MELASDDLSYIRKMVQDRSAIFLEDEKDYLIHSRLDPLAKELGCATLEEFVGKLRASPFGLMHKRSVEAMTTNETSFFRDINPFNALRETVLPELIEKNKAKKTLNIWCGASSSGQEPYSVVFLMKEHFPELESWNVRFIATDLSQAMIKRCQEGKYNQLEVNRGLPAAMLVKYFQKKGMAWQVKDEIRSKIEFREMNLIETWIPFPQLDLVFLRNVLIYFDVPTKKTIIGKIRQTLGPQSYLVLGGAETTFNLDESFERVGISGTSFYRLRQQ